MFQGTYIDTKHEEIEKLIENVKNNHTSPENQRDQLDLLGRLNRMHASRRKDDGRLDARVKSFELAYRMQMEATDAFDINPGAGAREGDVRRRSSSEAAVDSS